MGLDVGNDDGGLKRRGLERWQANALVHRHLDKAPGMREEPAPVCIADPTEPDHIRNGGAPDKRIDVGSGAPRSAREDGLRPLAVVAGAYSPGRQRLQRVLRKRLGAEHKCEAPRSKGDDRLLL